MVETRSLSPVPSGLRKMIYTLLSLLVLFWLIGLVAHIGGGLIHLLLVAALCVYIFNVVTGSRAA